MTLSPRYLNLAPCKFNQPPGVRKALVSTLAAISQLLVAGKRARIYSGQIFSLFRDSWIRMSRMAGGLASSQPVQSVKVSFFSSVVLRRILHCLQSIQLFVSDVRVDGVVLALRISSILHFWPALHPLYCTSDLLARGFTAVSWRYNLGARPPSLS